MKFSPVFPVSALLVTLICLPMQADIPAELKPTADPQLESLTANELLKLIREIRTPAGEKQLYARFDSPPEALNKVVTALAALGRYKEALNFCEGPDRLPKQQPGDYIAVPLSEEKELTVPLGAGTQSRPLAEMSMRSDIYQEAIYRKIAYGKRAEARALVKQLNQPHLVLRPLLWLAASALRDGQRAEATVDLRNALKVGGERASRHEWLALLMDRAGHKATATQIFKRCQQKLETTEPGEYMDDLPPDEAWGSFCMALLRAGRTNEALTHLKKHPKAVPIVMSTYLTGADTPQKRQVLALLAKSPAAQQFANAFASNALLSVRQKSAPLTDAQIEKIERASVQEIAALEPDSPMFFEERDTVLAKAASAWLMASKPERMNAFLMRPAFKLNDSQRAAIEALALLGNATFKFGGLSIRAKRSALKIPPAQTQQLALELASRFRRFGYQQIWANSFSDINRYALNLMLDAGDKPSALAVVKSSEMAIERNWRLLKKDEYKGPFLAEFVLLAARFRAVGDTASTDKWLDRYRKQIADFPKSVQIEDYQRAGFVKQAREVAELLPVTLVDLTKPGAEDGPDIGNNLRWENFAGFEGSAAAVKSPSTKDLVPFPIWCRRLTLNSRAVALPSFAEGLSVRAYDIGNSIRDSGFWERD